MAAIGWALGCWLTFNVVWVVTLLHFRPAVRRELCRWTKDQVQLRFMRRRHAPEAPQLWGDRFDGSVTSTDTPQRFTV
jgi:hypothetical protein